MATNSGNKGKIFMIGGIVAAAAVVVFLQNYPPKPQDAAGTVGAAQRYHETQITGSDVTVSPDAVATWIQSDTFDRIAKDPAARALFASEAFQQAIQNDAIRQVIGSDAIKQALS